MPKRPDESSPLRATVPLFYGDFASSGRKELCNGVVLAELTAREGERIRSYHSFGSGSLPAPMFRVEVFLELGGGEYEELAERKVRRSLQLLACASNALPVWLSLPIDRFSSVSGHWERSAIRYGTAGGHRPVNMWEKGEAIQGFFGHPAGHGVDSRWVITSDQIERWSQLLSHWPNDSHAKRLAVAREYFAEAIADLLGDERRAILAASICLEALFGDNAPELRHRTSQRLAHLLAIGPNAQAIYERAKAWYDARSRLVHSGAAPQTSLAVEAVSHLRLALGAMARLVELCGSHDAALRMLDSASFLRPEALRKLDAEPSDSWWRFPFNAAPPPVLPEWVCSQ